MGILPSRVAASMLATNRGHDTWTWRPSGAVDILANSGHRDTACPDHWMEVWCSLFLFTPTVARKSRHSTWFNRASVERHWTSMVYAMVGTMYDIRRPRSSCSPGRSVRKSEHSGQEMVGCG